MIDGEAGSTVQRQRGLSPRRMIGLTLPWIAQRFSFYGISFLFFGKRAQRSEPNDVSRWPPAVQATPWLERAQGVELSGAAAPTWQFRFSRSSDASPAL
jgi:hypothetical protein